MTDDALDHMLRALPPPPDPPDRVDDGLLQAYLGDALSPARAAELEGRLAASRDDRDLLLALSEPVPEPLYTRLGALFPSARPRRARWPFAALAAAAAVAAALWLVASPPALPPDYVVDGPSGGVKHARAAADTPVTRARPESRLKWVLRPRAALDGPAPSLEVFVARPEGPLRPASSADVTAGAGGAFRVTARAGALFDVPGEWEVHLALGEQGRLDLGGLRAAEARARAGVRLESFTVQFTTDSPEDP